MIRVTQQNCARDAKRYYAVADYYSEGQELIGCWGGKAASMLGLRYPGGPALSRAAEGGDASAYRFPRALVDGERLDFSFSGLKTALRYAIAPPPACEPLPIPADPRQITDLAASFQEAIVDVLAAKALTALQATGFDTLCVGGGVAANRRLRARLSADAVLHRFRLYIAPPELCTDNAVMGAIAIGRLRAGLVESLDLDVSPAGVRGG